MCVLSIYDEISNDSDNFIRSQNLKEQIKLVHILSKFV